MKAGITIPAFLLFALGVTVTARAQQVPIKEEKPGLLRQATVSPDSARAVALRRIPGGTISAAEIEREDGKLVYSFILKVAGKAGVEEVNVDAKTGAVVSVEHENQ